MANVKIMDHMDLSDDDREFVVKHSAPKPSLEHIDAAAIAMAQAGGPEANVKGSRQGLANDIKKIALQQKNDADRKRLLGIAEKFEASINIPKLSRAQQLRLDIMNRKRRTHGAAEAAEVQYKFSQARQGKRSLVAPEDRERFERLLGNRPPKPKEKPKEGPTAGQAAAQVAARHLRTRQIEKSSQPAPRRNVRTPKLHIKKSGLPKLTKGKNVKLQVPSGKLPRTQQVRNILNRSR